MIAEVTGDAEIAALAEFAELTEPAGVGEFTKLTEPAEFAVPEEVSGSPELTRYADR